MAFKFVKDEEEEPKPGFKLLADEPEEIINFQEKLPDGKKAPKIVREIAKEPMDESLWQKTKKAYNKTIVPVRRSVTSALNAGVEKLQEDDLSEYLTSPVESNVGLVRDMVKAGMRGFQGKEDLSGKDILKAIPEVKNPVPIPGTKGVLRKTLEQAVDKFISYREKRDDGTEVERFSHLNSDDDSVLTDFTDTVARVASLSDPMTKSALNIVSGVLRNPQPVANLVDKMAGYAIPGMQNEQTTDALNVPKRVAEFSIDVLTDPLNVVLPGVAGAGKKATAALMGIPKVANGVKMAVEALKAHPGLKVFQRAYGAPKPFVELLDQTTLRIAKTEEQALAHATHIRDNFTPAENQRIAQVVKSGFNFQNSTADDLVKAGISKRSDLIEAAQETQRIFGEIETEAKQLGILKDSFRTPLTRKQLATLRKERDVLQARLTKTVERGAFPQKDRILELANKVSLQGDIALGNELRQAATNVSIKGFKIKDELNQVMNAVDESTKMPVRSKAKLMNLLLKTDSVSEKAQYETVQEIMDIADDVKDLKIKGLKPLIKNIAAVSGRFHGRAGYIKELEENVDEITNRIYTHYTKGGQGYLPRLYDFFEKGYQKKLGDVGLKLKDIVALEGDQLTALNSLNAGEFDELIKKLAQVKNEGFGKRVTGIPADAFKRRQDVSEALRKALGEITTTDYPLAARAGIQKRAVEFQKFYKTVSENPEWAMPLDEFKKAPKDGWMKMPESKALGELGGKMVRSDIGRELQHTARSLGKWHEGWLKALSAWKSGKVLYNPATHFRNFMSNIVLMDASGVDILEQPRLISKAAREIANKGKYWDEANQVGLFTNSGYADAELRTFLSGFEKVKDDIFSRSMHAAKQVTDKLGQVYSSNEAMFKMAKFIHLREKGVDPTLAFQEAEKWLFNYSKLAPATRVLRSMPLGSPFITFTAKALPRMAESFVNNPLRLYKYKAMFNAMEDMAQEKLGLSEDDIRYAKRSFKGTGVVLPVADAEGNPHVLDVSYIMPWGDITEGAGSTGIPSAIPPGGPLKALLEARANFSEFTGKPIRNPTENYYVQAADTLDFIGKSMMPSLTPGVPGKESPFRGGYSFNKILASIKKEPDYLGRVRSLSMVLADTLMGLKAYPVDPDQARAFEAIRTQRAFQDRIGILKRVMRHPGISEEAKARERMRFRTDIQNIMRKMVE